MILFTFLFAFLFCIISAVDENDAEIFVAAETVIWRMNLNGSDKREFATAVNATSLDYHHAKGLLFWSDVATHKIYSKALFDDSAEVNTVVEGSDDWTPRAIAVDYVHDKIYVMDQAGEKIDLFRLDGRRVKEGIKRGIVDPKKSDDRVPKVLDIAVDPYKKLVFYGAYDKVYRAPLDFSRHQYIGDKDTNSGIAIDIANQNLYFSDNFALISKMDYTGAGEGWINARDHPSDYVRGTPIMARSIAVYDKYYFLDRSSKLLTLEKWSNYPTEIKAGVKNGWTLRIRHPSLQRKPQ